MHRAPPTRARGAASVRPVGVCPILTVPVRRCQPTAAAYSGMKQSRLPGKSNRGRGPSGGKASSCYNRVEGGGGDKGAPGMKPAAAKDMKRVRASVIIAVVMTLALAAALAGCAGDGAGTPGQATSLASSAGSPTQTTTGTREYLPLEHFSEGTTSHLRFLRTGGHVTINYHGVVVFVETTGASEITTRVRTERVSAVRLDLHMADDREFSPGDVIEVTIQGQFPDSPARFGAVIEDANIILGLPTGYTNSEYLTEQFFASFRDRGHILYTVAMHARS